MSNKPTVRFPASPAKKTTAAPASAPDKSPVNPPAPSPATPAKGTKGNPWTGDDAPEDKAARAGQWLKLQNNTLFQFGNEGQGPKGNWRGTSNGDGSGTGKKGNSAARLHALFTGSAIPQRLTGESEEIFNARKLSVEIGNLIGKAVAGSIRVKLAKVEGGEITRNLTVAELQAMPEFGAVPVPMLQNIKFPKTFKVEAQEEREIPATELEPFHVLAEREESRVQALICGAPSAAFRTASA